MSVSRTISAKVSIFMPSFRGGGAEKVMLGLGQGLSERGAEVDLVVAQNEGPFAAQVPSSVRIADLRARRVIASLPALVRYLRDRRPAALLSALPHANVVAVWARTLARVETRLVLSEHNTASVLLQQVAQRRARLLPVLMRRAYPHADAIVAVSDGVADDLARLLRIPRSRITRIYNPVITPQLFTLAAEPVGHPWFAAGEPPVILAAGRLTAAKDFQTLISAFAIVRKHREARLMILGEGGERPDLEALIARLGLDADVTLPGFVLNPYKFMRSSSVFVLCSRWEGFGNVLVEAMACSVPVISTDCPNGPREILESGRHGSLTPVGDAPAMAREIVTALDRRPGSSALERARTFTLSAALDSYRSVLAV